VTGLKLVFLSHEFNEVSMDHPSTKEMIRRSFRRTLSFVLLFLASVISESTGQIFPAPGSGPPAQSGKGTDETRFLGGISGSGIYNAYSRGIPMVYTPICNHLDAGAGFGYAFGLNASYLLGPDLRLTGHVRYASHPGSFEIFQVIGRAWGGNEEMMGFVTIRIGSDVEFRALESDLMLMWNVGRFNQDRSILRLGIGPYAAWKLRATMSQEHVMEIYSIDGEFLTERDVSTFGGEDVVHTNLAKDLEMTRARRLQYGLRLGASVEYHLGNGLYVTPGMFVDIAAIPMTDFNWGELTSWSLQTDLSIGL
jgi:hypothetical protein